MLSCLAELDRTRKDGLPSRCNAGCAGDNHGSVTQVDHCFIYSLEINLHGTGSARGGSAGSTSAGGVGTTRGGGTTGADEGAEDRSALLLETGGELFGHFQILLALLGAFNETRGDGHGTGTRGHSTTGGRGHGSAGIRGTRGHGRADGASDRSEDGNEGGGAMPPGAGGAMPIPSGLTECAKKCEKDEKEPKKLVTCLKKECASVLSSLVGAGGAAPTGAPDAAASGAPDAAASGAPGAAAGAAVPM